MYDPDETASTVREALHCFQLVSDHTSLAKLTQIATNGHKAQTMKDAADIASDLLTEAGIYASDERDLAWRAVHRAFAAGFLHGAKCDLDTENETDTQGSYAAAGKSIYRLVDGCPEWIFHELMDKAYAALVELADDPGSPGKKGAYDQAVESLRTVLHVTEKDAYWVVLDVTIHRNAIKKENG